MRKLAMTIAAGAALSCFAVPALAHDNYSWSRHDRQHEQLEDQHDDIHDQLEDEHAAAHEEGLTPWEHRQLHRDLEYQHARADYQLQREHARQHRREQWRRYFESRRYNNGYRNW